MVARAAFLSQPSQVTLAALQMKAGKTAMEKAGLQVQSKAWFPVQGH
jgi:hypothetical protein